MDAALCNEAYVDAFLQWGVCSLARSAPSRCNPLCAFFILFFICFLAVIIVVEMHSDARVGIHVYLRPPFSSFFQMLILSLCKKRCVQQDHHH